VPLKLKKGASFTAWIVIFSLMKSVIAFCCIVSISKTTMLSRQISPDPNANGLGVKTMSPELKILGSSVKYCRSTADIFKEYSGEKKKLLESRSCSLKS
jgi:hypothetical protein